MLNILESYLIWQSNSENGSLVIKTDCSCLVFYVCHLLKWLVLICSPQIKGNQFRCLETTQVHWCFRFSGSLCFFSQVLFLSVCVYYKEGGKTFSRTPPPPCLYLVNRGELCSDGPSMESGAVPESPRGPLPAAVQHPAGGLLSVQGSGRRFVSSELGATLPVAMWGARLPMQAVVAAGPRSQPLGNVLRVGGGAALTGTAVDEAAERAKSKTANK